MVIMVKVIISMFILVLTLGGAVWLYDTVFSEYPTFGTFENLLYLGLVTFGLGLGLFASALLMESVRTAKK